MLKKFAVYLFIFILTTGCFSDTIDQYSDYSALKNEEFTEPNYNIPRNIPIEDIETVGDITNLIIDNGSESGNYYETISFNIESENSGIIIYFREYSPLRFDGTGVNGGYAVAIDFEYLIPNDTYLDLTFIPPENDTIFTSFIPLDIIYNLTDNTYHHGGIINFTDDEIGIIKRRFEENDFYGFQLSIIVRPVRVVTDSRVSFLDLEYRDLLFSDYGNNLSRFLNILTGTDDITNILEGLDQTTINRTNAAYVVSTGSLGGINETITLRF